MNGQNTQEPGRDKKGRFAVGNHCSRGRQVTELRRAVLDAVTPEDIRDVVGKIVELAKQGNIQAIQILFDRCIGKPMAAQEYELYTHEYDREDFSASIYDVIQENEMQDQIRPLQLKR